MNANPITTVGLMLTLAGLVGTFFNIQLSQWLRDLIALDQKVLMNKAKGNPDQIKAMFECRIELKKLGNITTYLVNVLVILFVIYVLSTGLGMVRNASADPLYPAVNQALWVFLAFFVAMSAGLFARGSYLVYKNRKVVG